MTKFSRLILGCSLVGVVILATAIKAAAAAPLSPHGITVSPALQQVSIPDNVKAEPIAFSITNNESSPQTLSLSVADFNTLDESGGLFFIGTNPTALQKKYGLAKWISLPTKNLTISPGQTAKVQASILNLPALPSGGHYGALLISLNSANLSSGSSQVGLHPIASSLLFVSKLSGATYDLSLADVNYKHRLVKLPTAVELRFLNSGNNHLVPRGSVTLTSSNGTLISKGIINQDSGIILPQTYRRFNVGLQNVSSTNPVGKYKLNVSYRFDGYEGSRNYQASFWYMPMAWLIAIGLGLVIVVYIIYRTARRLVKSKRSSS